MDKKHLSRKNGWFIVTCVFEDEVTWIYETKNLHEALSIIFEEV